MKIIPLIAIILIIGLAANAQPKKPELYDLIVRLLPAGQEEGAVGDWSVSKPNAFGVKWQDEGIKMSDDLKINFYRRGTIDLATAGATAKWKIMLKGARSGFSSFSLTSPVLTNTHSPIKLDALLGKHNYVSKVLQNCHDGAGSGFAYYQLQIPGKGPEWVKISWNCSSAGCSFNIDCYDDFSKQYAELQCR